MNHYENCLLDEMLAAFRVLCAEYQYKGYANPETWKAAKMALLKFDQADYQTKEVWTQ